MSDEPNYSQLADIYTSLAKEQVEQRRVRCDRCRYQGPEKTGTAGVCLICSRPAERVEPFTPEQARWIREEVDRALHPGVSDPSRYLRVSVTDPETGHEYGGLLYLRVPEMTMEKPKWQRVDPRPSGVCWACGVQGNDLVWFVKPHNKYMVHERQNCLQMADEKPEEDKS